MTNVISPAWRKTTKSPCATGRTVADVMRWLYELGHLDLSAHGAQALGGRYFDVERDADRLSADWREYAHTDLLCWASA